MLRFILFVFVGLLLSAASMKEMIGAELKLAHIFQDNMVLQRDMKVPIWGWGDAGTKVTVNFGGQKKTAVAGKDRYWRVNLDPMPASVTGKEMIISYIRKSKIENRKLNNILVGEVWLCAGQSNMDFHISKLLDTFPLLKKRLGAVDYPLIRFIVYQPYASAKPLKDMDPGVHGPSKWETVNSSTVGLSMAIPFFFARKLYEELKIPVGTIQVAVGATNQGCWCPREVIDQVAAETGSRITYDYLFKKAEKAAAKGKRFKAKSWTDYEKLNAAWQKERKGRYPDGGRGYPCVLFNAQIHPLAPFAFRGMLWHQGEDGPYNEHAERMVALVTYWRKFFENDFYYLWGGLSRDTRIPPPLAPILNLNYRANRNRLFLQAQKMFGYNSKSVFCDFFDLGDFNTHFGEKDKAGERFALAAFNCIHGKSNVFTGPQLIETKVKPGEIQLKFTHAGSGLVYKPSIDGISGFILESGKDYFWLEPTIVEKDKLIFKHDKITDKSRIYYGYHFNPHETLFNQEGFPASIFPKEIYTKTPKQKDVIELVKFISKPPQNVFLNITHVRHNAFVFSIDSWSRKEKHINRVQVYIPKEWKSVGARYESKEIKLGNITTNPQGQRMVELDVKTNAGPYIIYNKSKSTEAMKNADLSRF